MRRLIILITTIVILTSCGDSESTYLTSIINNTGYEIIVRFSGDSTIVCESNQETIIFKDGGGSTKKMYCMTPIIFMENYAEIIIEGGEKVLTKDIYNDSNWSCKGEKNWSLVMVGNFYSEVTTTFAINNEDVKDAEQ